MIKVLLIAVLSKCVFTEGLSVIGGLFYDGSDDMAAALRASAGIFNFTASVKTVSAKGQILEAGEHVCSLAEEGVIGIIDGTSGRMSAHVQAICDLLDIPHILIDHNDLVQENWLHLNLNPSPVAYNEVLEALITMKEWNNFTIMYEKGYSLLRVTSLLEMASKNLTVSIRELSGSDYRQTLINSKENQYTNFVVDCPLNKLEQFLIHAQQVGLMADEHSYVFLSPDLFTLDLTPYRYGGVNMTGFRLVNLNDEKFLLEFVSKMESEIEIGSLSPEEMGTNLFLIHDAVRVFSEASMKMINMTIKPGDVNCQDFSSWKYGSSLLNFMKTNRIEGVTGPLLFDDAGQRSEVNMEILELTPAGHQAVGIWGKWNSTTKKSSIQVTRPNLPSADPSGDSLMKNKTFTIEISITPPHAYLRNSTDILEGNDRYEGFAVDLIGELGKMLGFYYEFEVNQKYGGINTTTGETDGMVGDIVHEKADFAITDFTITSNRQLAIDFSIPFMSLGIGILYKEPSKQPPELFSFMAVFAPEVWYYMVLIQLALGVVLIIVGRLSHKEWQNPVPCDEDPEELSNQFSFANSVWLIIGSVMQQGSEIAPIALAPRLITSVWWFFTMIMVASYVGTLVAFLTVEKNVLPFTNVKELYEQKSIAYGAKSVGSTITFFENQPPGSMYRNMYDKMVANNWNVGENDFGVMKAEKSSYAFFMESSAIEYYKERHCELLQIGDLLDSKSYGIGMRKDTPYKKLIDDALLKLMEKGVVQKLKDKWWKEKHGGGKCGKEETVEEPLGMKHMTGVFVVLGVGSLMGLFISVIDMLWGVFKRSMKYSTTFKYELIEELKFALKFHGDVKPVKRPEKTDGSAEDLKGEEEGKDVLESLRSLSPRTTDSHGTNHSHSSRASRHSSLSIAFARRRKYS